jgi:hypothetical protein
VDDKPIVHPDIRKDAVLEGKGTIASYQYLSQSTDLAAWVNNDFPWRRQRRSEAPVARAANEWMTVVLVLAMPRQNCVEREGGDLPKPKW